ncbi:drug/metabolite transporter (DMT)-like permease [Kitasatospora sp. MAA4]|uniref:DMT family transporter n=1 Tax=Kitasatospora sp. MAA4 TaxID=3035093 RepID=UPI002474B800|nr:DMT family transporter [Kitasatospora sp. MAA4]MDH6135545.1 drug/metabolite transporter (DMT)-like permease [Kitasatospora sp. MAA4]
MTSQQGSPARLATPALSNGTLYAALGVVSFSFSFPGTVWALDGFGPWSAIGVRGVLAAVIAIGALLITRAPLPARTDWPALAVVAGGCAIGFPLLTTLALQTSSTADSAVVIGALPMATAVFSAVLTRRSPSKVFWAAAGLGAATVIVFTLSQNHGRPTVADLFLFGALLVCAAGYANGGRLSARMPGWRVIAWGVVLAAPVNLAVALWALSHEPVHLTAKAVVGMAYIAGISQFGGFVVWYKGMGLIGVARASQLQLAQPLLTLVWAVLLLGEQITAAVPLTAAIVLSCIVVTQRARTS